VARCVLSEKLIITSLCVIKCLLVVLWFIKEFLIVRMSMVIILRVLLIKVRNPTELTIYISVIRHLRVLGNACPLLLVIFVGVGSLDLSQVFNFGDFRLFKIFIEVLFAIDLVLFIECTRSSMMALIPAKVS